MINRLKRLERFFQVKTIKSLKVFFVNSDIEKQEILKTNNKTDCLMIEFV